MKINHNISALNTYNKLNSATNAQSKSMEKLSSGLRINSAADDAAGLAISEKMRGQIRGLDMAAKNSQDGISLIQTAEGALSEVHSILQRQRELAVQASSDTNVEADRTALQDEFDQLSEEIGRIKDTTQFNTMNLLNASAGTGGVLQLQVGANSSQLMEIDLSTAGIDLSALHTAVSALTLDTNTDANAAMDALDTQIASVSSGRSYLGAAQNRLEHTINNLNTSSENLTAAESRVRDVDYALVA
ncbi:flagellin [Cytobacillus oceanisediminis]|uniref:flagellin N-terminal helical domain-containing protein n=1 Tax=Cytobacillus oceanisediminis TaxID=665099 RepID=UPI001CCF770B|nr:flagellin [Cytobacillus oceanisediminis]MBZ9535251.1 flagellin [Cytobacillus oceanisediminis]